MQWDKIANIILLTSFAVLAVFAGLGLYQLITRKSLKKVDKNLLLAPIPLALMAATYFIFGKIWVLNTRPDGSGEPSFPSTHVMVVATIFALTALNLKKYICQKPLRIVIYLLMLVLTILTCIGRVLADKHWLSDVLAALIFSAIFATIYYLTIRSKHNG